MAPPGMSVSRMQTIMVDADLGRPPIGYTEAELEFRSGIERELAEMHARGEVLDFTPDIDFFIFDEAD